MGDFPSSLPIRRLGTISDEELDLEFFNKNGDDKDTTDFAADDINGQDGQRCSRVNIHQGVSNTLKPQLELVRKVCDRLKTEYMLSTHIYIY